MLIINLNAKKGLINGARLVVTQLGNYTITVKLIDVGQTVVIVCGNKTARIYDRTGIRRQIRNFTANMLGVVY